MRLTQGTFSYLPELTDDQIRANVQYALSQNYSVNVEWTDDPHPRNCYWELWGLPLFDITDPAAVMFELAACRKSKPNTYIKINAFDNAKGVESCVMSFIVQRPDNEPGFQLVRAELGGRKIGYTITSYSNHKPAGERY